MNNDVNDEIVGDTYYLISHSITTHEIGGIMTTRKRARRSSILPTRAYPATAGARTRRGEERARVYNHSREINLYQ